MKKKGVIIVAVVSLATCSFGLGPSEVVRLFRAALTNDAASREWTALRVQNQDLFWELKSRMNGVELLLLYGIIDSVSVSSTDLTITFATGGLLVDYNGTIRNTAEYAEANEPLILTPDQGASLFQYDSSIMFTPVSFKDKRKGFRVINQFNMISHGEGLKNWFGYVALSDSPVEVGEDDVEMILEGGEWVKFEGNKVWEMGATWAPPVEKRGGAQETPPTIEAPVAANVATASLPLTEDGTQRLEAVATIDTPPNRLWLYALIPLALAVLWLAHRKRKHDSKN